MDRIQRLDQVPHRRIIIYANDEQLRTLFSSPHIMMDRTFDSCPPRFEQTYFFHAMKNIRRLKLKFRFTKIPSDFELAPIKR